MTTVIYDSACGFCNWCRRFAERRGASPIRFVGYDTQDAHTLLAPYPGLYEQRAETIIVFTEAHVPQTKFAACRMIARHMRAPWPAIATLLGIVPGFLGDLCYDLVAWARPLLSRLVS